MYVVQVEQNALRATSDPMEAPTALKVAKAWQSHGDRGVRIVEARDGKETPASWNVREFIAFIRGPTASARRVVETAGNTAGG